MTPAEEKALVQRCLAGGSFGNASGDDSPWTAFVGAYAPALRGAIRNTLRRMGASADEESVEELLQETWAAVLKDGGALLREFRWECPLGPFLAVVAASRSIDFLRSRRGLWEARREAACRELGRRAGESPDAARGVETAEARAQIAGALGRLPRREQLILRLFYWENLPAEEIAGLLQVQKRSVWPLLARARGRLKELLRSFAVVL